MSLSDCVDISGGWSGGKDEKGGSGASPYIRIERAVLVKDVRWKLLRKVGRVGTKRHLFL